MTQKPNNKKVEHFWSAPPQDLHACNCVGPQNGDPVCPCQMAAYSQRQAERAAWEREQLDIAKIYALHKEKP